MKKILFVGVFSQSHSNNIPQVDEFRKKGYIVDTYDYRAVSASKRTSSLDKKLDLISRFLRQSTVVPSFMRAWYFKEKGRAHLQGDLLAIARKGYDLIFISKGEELSPSTVAKLKEHSKIFYYFMDPIHTAKTIGAEKIASLADYSSATTSLSVDFFSQHGAHAHLIPQGFDPKLYLKLPLKKTKGVTFVGSMTGKRKKYVQALQRAGIQVEVYGPHTKNGPVYSRQLIELNAQSKIILNFVREEGGFSVRVYQAMATGSLVLTEYCSDLTKYFRRKEHIDWFSSPSECIALVRHYLKDEKKRESIAAKGKKLVYEKFTWEDQIRQIIDVIEPSVE